MDLGISYSKFRKLFNSTTSTSKIRVFIHKPDEEGPLITFLNRSDEFDDFEISRIEWSVLKNDNYEPMIQADVWVS
jgi:hypothetical protein